jgi:hypothetical protein
MMNTYLDATTLEALTNFGYQYRRGDISLADALRYAYSLGVADGFYEDLEETASLGEESTLPTEAEGDF